MKPYYQVDVTYHDGGKNQLHFESLGEALALIRLMLGCSSVDSAILGHYSNVYPTGYDVICSIKNKTNLRGRKM